MRTASAKGVKVPTLKGCVVPLELHLVTTYRMLYVHYTTHNPVLFNPLLIMQPANIPGRSYLLISFKDISPPHQTEDIPSERKPTIDNSYEHLAQRGT